MATQVLFKTVDRTFAIEVKHINPHVVRILDALSAVLTLHESGFELSDTPNNVLISGDDSYGAVTHISVWDGHLLLIANFGDDGEMIFSPTAPRGKVNNDLPSDLIALMDEECEMASPTFFINPMDDYIIGQYFNCAAI